MYHRCINLAPAVGCPPTRQIQLDNPKGIICHLPPFMKCAEKLFNVQAVGCPLPRQIQ